MEVIHLKDAMPDIKPYLKVYEQVGKVLVDNKLSPMAALTIITAMSEALYVSLATDQERFADPTKLQEILGTIK